MKFQAPTSKHQRSFKLQASAPLIGVLELDVLWCLELEIWSF